MTSNDGVGKPDTDPSSHPSIRLPLEGIRVLDLTRALAGPFCTTLLADLGADVIKVESPSGDAIRTWGPFSGETSLYHLSVNRNKRSLVLDFRTDEGRELLRSLVTRCDVMVENFRRGVLEEIGIGKSWTDEHAPDTLVVEVSGYGPTGPLADSPAFDQIAQGMAGLMSITGPVGGSPTRVGLPIGDLLSGMFAALGVCATLAGRARGNLHTSVETSLLESVLGVMTFQAQRFLTNGEVPESTGNDHPTLSPYGLFTTADGSVNLAIGTQQQFATLCEILEVPEWISDPNFCTGRVRSIHRPELTERLERVLRRQSTAHWLELFRGNNIPAGPVNRMDEVFAEPQVVSLDMTQTIEHPDLGRVQVLRAPLRIDRMPLPVLRAAPTLGEHSTEILREFGFGEQQITDLQSRAIVRSNVSDGG